MEFIAQLVFEKVLDIFKIYLATYMQNKWLDMIYVFAVCLGTGECKTSLLVHLFIKNQLRLIYVMYRSSNTN